MLDMGSKAGRGGAFPRAEIIMTLDEDGDRR